MKDARLEQQLRFLLEIDQLKQVERRSYLADGSRRENSAEHSWHLAVMAVLLCEHLDDPGIDLLRVMKMLLIHDLVEIDAGDTYAYDPQGQEDKYERELACANRLFRLLPEEQRDELMALWQEFEEGSSPEAKYAAALDRLQPMLLNYAAQGKSWREHGIHSRQVLARQEAIAEVSQKLGDYSRGLIQDAVAKGYLKAQG